MGRILGIDYGQERVGLAISDSEGHIVLPLATLTLAQFGARAALLDALCARATSEAVEQIVVGLPLYEDGGENLSCRQVRNFVKRLKRRLSLPMFYMPELLSSAEAREDLLAAGIRGAKLKAVLDQQAACNILSSFLAQPFNRRMAA